MSLFFFQNINTQASNDGLRVSVQFFWVPVCYQSFTMVKDLNVLELLTRCLNSFQKIRCLIKLAMDIFLSLFLDLFVG